MEGLVCGQLVPVGFRLPDPAARAADVPVRQVVDESLDAAGRLDRLVGVQAPGDPGDQRAQLGQEPAIQHVPLVDRHGRLRRVEIEPRVKDEKRVAVPQRDEELLHGFTQRVLTGPVVLADLGRGVEVPAHRVGPKVLEQVVGIQHIAARLRCFLSFRIDHVSEADDVAVCVLPEEQRRDRKQGVEPAAGLVDRL